MKKCSFEFKSFVALVLVVFSLPFILIVAKYYSYGKDNVVHLIVKNDSVINEIGHGYLVKIPDIVFDGELSEVYEDGKRLDDHESLHTEIRNGGEGRYSFFQGHLLFSASDNSDPRINGKVYDIRLYKKLWFESFRNLRRLLLAFCLVSVGLILWARRICPWAGPLLGGNMAAVTLLLPIFLGVSWYTIGFSGNRASILHESMWDSVLIEPDSGSYMGWYEVRTPGYPFFLRALVEPTPENLGLSTMSDFQVPPVRHPFIIITRTQIVLFLAALFGAGVMLSIAAGPVAPLALSLGMLLYGGIVASYLSRVMSEGLHLPLMLLLIGLTIFAATRQGKLLNALIGALFFVCLLVMPRFLGAVPLLVIPAAGAFVRTRSLRETLRSGAGLSLLTFALLYLGYCTWGYSRFGAFAMAPTNGYSSVGIALALAKPGDELLLRGAEEQDLLRYAIDLSTASSVVYPDPNYVNANINIAFKACVEKGASVLPSGKDKLFTECNAFWAKANALLVKKHRGAFVKHVCRIFKDLNKYTPILSNWGWLALAVLACVYAIRRRNAVAAVAALLICTHFFNALFTGSLQDIVDRYVATTVWLLPLALGLFGAAIFEEVAGRLQGSGVISVKREAR